MISVLAGMTLANQAPARITLPGSPLGAAWGFLYGAGGTKAEKYLPELRKLGGGFTKVYLFWHQIEPERGKFDWTAVDSFVDGLKSPEEGLVSLFSISAWATERNAAALPPSPAKDQDDYYRFVYALVKHCRGRVRYWENDAEPNNPVYWAGTKAQYVMQLHTFYRAVKAADPHAIVVCGGYDGLFNPPPMPPKPNQQAGLDFFDTVVREGHDAFDAFDLRLYADPYTIPARVDYFRRKLPAGMPILCTEYNGPGFFEFPLNRKYGGLATAWSQAIATAGTAAKFKPIEDLYTSMASLAPETQMFLRGCPPELEAKFQRLQARSLVMRNLFAFSAGVQKTLYWQFAETEGERDDLMTLMYGKIGMMASENGRHIKRLPIADTFARMAERLRGLRSVRRVELPDHPSIYLFEVDRGRRGPLNVLWDRREIMSGEDAPAISFVLPWKAKKARAVDLFGKPVATKVDGENVRLDVSVDPIYLEPTG